MPPYVTLVASDGKIEEAHRRLWEDCSRLYKPGATVKPPNPEVEIIIGPEKWFLQQRFCYEWDRLKARPSWEDKKAQMRADAEVRNRPIELATLSAASAEPSPSTTTAPERASGLLALYQRAAYASQAGGIFVLRHAIPATEKGGKSTSNVERFSIDRMGELESVAKERGKTENVYFTTALRRPDLRKGKLGEDKDIVAVLSFVLEEDGDKDDRLALPPGIQPTFIVQSSLSVRQNRHLHFVLDRAISFDEAHEIALLFSSKIGGDNNTSNIGKAWRVPGTLNHPDWQKLNRGRTAKPLEVAEIGDSGQLVDPDEWKAALDAMPYLPGREPRGFQGARRLSERGNHKTRGKPNGHQYNGGGNGEDRDSIRSRLPRDLVDAINFATEGDRSAYFQSVIWRLARFLTLEEIIVVSHGAPFASKYADRENGKFEAEIVRSYEKWQAEQAEEETKQGDSGRQQGETGRTAKEDAKKSPPKEDKKPSQVDILLGFIKRAELFHAPDGKTFADVVINGHRETLAIKSPSFRRWLIESFHRKTGGAPSSAAKASALDVADAQASYQNERTVHVRVAEHDGKFYVDLCNKDWQCIEIAPDGWRIIGSPPVRFRRAPGMLPFPPPIGGGSIDDLKEFVNVSDDDFKLVVAWCLVALSPRGPYPVLTSTGTEGTGKTTINKVLRALVDPNELDEASLPKELRDLFIHANHRHLVSYDNISRLPDLISDGICRLGGGGGHADRTLYENDEEHLFKAEKPVCLTGIEGIVKRPDLMDRNLPLKLDQVEKRRTSAEFWAAFEEKRPLILGALLDGMAIGLAHLPQTKIKDLPRMADFATWATACETAYWKPGTFMKVYGESIEGAAESVILNDPVGSAVLELMEGIKSFQGSATELLERLDGKVSQRQLKHKSWPVNARALSAKLKRLSGAFKKQDIKIELKRSKAGSQITITDLKKAAAASKKSRPYSDDVAF